MNNHDVAFYSQIVCKTHANRVYRQIRKLLV